jgi:hypothetical protein
MNILCLSSSVRIAHIACYWKSFPLHCIKVLCQYKLARQTMPILRSLCYNGSLVAWTVVRLTAAKFTPHRFSVWFRLVRFYDVHCHDFVWLLLVACTILLCIRKVENRAQIAEIWKRELQNTKHVTASDGVVVWWRCDDKYFDSRYSGTSIKR